MLAELVVQVVCAPRENVGNTVLYILVAKSLLPFK